MADETGALSRALELAEERIQRQLQLLLKLLMRLWLGKLDASQGLRHSKAC